MGKYKNRTKKSNVECSVSIVTITQLKRNESLKILEELIALQNYKNIIEWVIVEGTSSSQEDKDLNVKNIDQLICNTKLTFPIIFVKPIFGTKLGQMRNMGNKECKGDITVCMDDDDFYSSKRVSHAVDMLSKSKCLIAGCSTKLMYDYTLDKMYTFNNKFGSNHSTNDCMAWKKEYLLTNSHDPNKEFGEEESFTKKYSQKMIQLDPKKVLIGSIHSHNTYDKRKLCILASMGLHNMMYEMSDDSVLNYIPMDFLNRYRSLFSIPVSDCHYDVVYHIPLKDQLFDVETGNYQNLLDFNNNTILEHASRIVADGKKVAVYGNLVEKNVNGIDFIHFYKFPFEKRLNTLIIWKKETVPFLKPFKINATETILVE